MRTTVLLLSALALLLLPGCAWFAVGGVTGIVLFLQPEVEPETAPAVLITAPERLLATPGSVTFSLVDAESDPCSVAVEYAVGAGDFHPATRGAGGDATSGLSASPSGSPHVFSWDYASDPDILSPETNDVTIRITATDSAGKQGTAVSTGHAVGNAPPWIASCTLPGGNVTGTATIRYRICDSHSDIARIRVQFRGECTDATWTDATPEDPIARVNIASAPAGRDHLYPWDSDHADDLQGTDDDVEIRISASDDDGNSWGAWLETAPDLVHIRNDTLPEVVIGVVPSTQSGLVHVPYTVTDAEGDEVTILAEYRRLGSTRWRRATAGPGTTRLFLAASALGTPGGFVWDTLKDGVLSAEATLRITPSQDSRVGLASTKDFVVGNDGSAVWFERASMGTARRFLGGAVLNGTIYAVGGLDMISGATGLLEAYDPATDAWNASPLAPMPTPRWRFGVAVAKGKLYVIGGSGGDDSAVVEAYDPVQDAWTTRNPMPTARDALACAAIGNKIYAAGGGFGAGLDTFEIYDVDEDTWTTGPPMPQPRCNLAGAALDGKFYAVGGYSSGNRNDVEVYDPATGWTSGLAPLPAARTDLTCVASGNRLYALGGSPGAIELDNAEVYDPDDDTWTILPSLITPRGGLAGAAAGGKIYVFGGFEGSTYLDSVEAFDSVETGWTSGLTALPVPRKMLGAAGLDGKIWAVGGTNGSACDHVEAYDPETGVWDASPADLPTARWLPLVVSCGGKIYAIGGSTNVTESFDPETGGWTSGLAPVPTARWASAGAAIDGKIYVAGGSSGGLTAVEAYDPSTDGWTTGLAPLPDARSWHVGACVNGILYLLGGFGGSAGPDCPVLAYDPASDTWWSGAVIPTGREHPACAVVGNIIYVAGGANASGHNLDALEAYDPGADVWSRLPDMPAGRESLACAAYRGRVFAIGGGFSSYLDTVESFRASDERSLLRPLGSLSSPLSGAGAAITGKRFRHAGGAFYGNPGTVANESRRLATDVPASGAFSLDPRWEMPALLGEGRRHPGVAEYGGLLYIVGGIDTSGLAMDAVERYDPASDTWEALPPLPTARGELGLARVGAHLYAIGGDANGDAAGGTCGTVEVYDLASDTWQTGYTSMPTARSRFGCAAEPDSGRIFAFGGEGAGDAFLDAVERYDPGSDAWSSRASAPVPVKGPLALFERWDFMLIGGELSHATLGSIPTDRILAYDPSRDVWRETGLTLPYAAWDLFGCTGDVSWDQRGARQVRSLTLLGGGADGTMYDKDGFFRLYTR